MPPTVSAQERRDIGRADQDGQYRDGRYRADEADNDRAADRDDRRREHRHGRADDRSSADYDDRDDMAVRDADISTIIVTGRGRDHGYAVDSSVGSKVREDPRNIPQTIVVVGRQRLEDQNIRTTQEALTQVAGFNATSQEASYTARGFSTGVMVDGAPSGSVAGRTDVDVEAFERVEVLKGAAALLQGNGQPGGVVNYVFKKPSRELAINGKLGIGTYDNYYGGVDLGGPITNDGNLRARGVAFYEDRDLYTRPEFRRRLTLYGTIQYDFTPRTTASIGYHRQRSRSSEGFRQGLPTYTDGALLDVSPRTSLSQDWNRWTKLSTSLLADIEHRFSENWIAKAAYRRGRSSLPSVVAYAGPTSRSEEPSACASEEPGAEAFLDTYRQEDFPGVDRSSPFGGLRCMNTQQYWDRGGTTSYETWVSGKFTVGGIEQKVLVGYNRREELFGRTLGSPGAGQDFVNDVLKPNPHARDRPVFKLGPKPEFSKTTDQGVYGQLVISPIAWLKIPLGGRVSWYDNADSYSGDLSVNGKFTPYAGVVADLAPNLSAYFSYIESFESPGSSTRLVGGGLPPPIAGRQYEGGIKGALFGSAVQYSAAYFDILRTNQTSPNPDDALTVILSGDRQSKGFEAQFSGRVSRAFNISAGYAFTDATVKNGVDGPGGYDGGDYTGQRIEGTPKHSFNLFGTYEFLSGDLTGLRIGGGARAQSAQQGLFVCQTPEIATRTCDKIRVRGPGYTLTSLFAGYRLTRSMELALNVDNLFNRKYWQAVETVSGGNYLGSPRQAQLTLRARF